MARSATNQSTLQTQVPLFLDLNAGGGLQELHTSGLQKDLRAKKLQIEQEFPLRELIGTATSKNEATKLAREALSSPLSDFPAGEFKVFVIECRESLARSQADAFRVEVGFLNSSTQEQFSEKWSAWCSVGRTGDNTVSGVRKHWQGMRYQDIARSAASVESFLTVGMPQRYRINE